MPKISELESVLPVRVTILPGQVRSADLLDSSCTSEISAILTHRHQVCKVGKKTLVNMSGSAFPRESGSDERMAFNFPSCP